MAFASWPIAKAGAPERFIAMNIIEQIEKEQAAALAKKRKVPGIRARRHAPRQRQGGRGRPRPRAGL